MLRNNDVGVVEYSRRVFWNVRSDSSRTAYDFSILFCHDNVDTGTCSCMEYFGDGDSDIAVLCQWQCTVVHERRLYARDLGRIVVSQENHGMLRRPYHHVVYRRFYIGHRCYKIRFGRKACQSIAETFRNKVGERLAWLLVGYRLVFHVSFQYGDGGYDADIPGSCAEVSAG